MKLISRNKNDLTKRFDEIADSLAELPCDECVIDGEVVALDDEGRSSFQLLQAREMEAKKAPLCYYVFDLLQLDGNNLTGLPLTNRKELLRRLIANQADPIRYSGEIGGDARALLREVKRRGLEGLIGKLADSVYEPGRRSGAWIKLKCVRNRNSSSAVTRRRQERANISAHLLVGYYEKKKLLFAGKVGTGFDDQDARDAAPKIAERSAGDCPFADLPAKVGGAWVQDITPGMMRKMSWVNPVFVCQVKFAEWTRDAKLRAPVFLGLREDKAASQVRRE